MSQEKETTSLTLKSNRTKKLRDNKQCSELRKLWGGKYLHVNYMGSLFKDTNH